MNKSVINVKRIFLLLLIITVFIGVVFGFTVYSVGLSIYRNSYISNTQEFAESQANVIAANKRYESLVIEDLNEHLFNAGNNVLLNRDKLSNQYLEEVALANGVHYIWWYSPEGEIIFDSSYQYIGWTPTEGDPIDTFMKSGKDLHYDGMRQSTEGDVYYMVVYQRADDGYFVQTALDATFVNDMISDYSYETIVNEIVDKNRYISYSAILDTDFQIIALCDHDGLFVVIADDIEKSSIRSGETVVISNNTGNRRTSDLHIYTPVIIEDEVVGILLTAFTLNDYYDWQFSLGIMVTILIIIIIGVYVLLQTFEIILPLKKLNDSLTTFDINSGSYNKPKHSGKTFNTLFASIETISKNIAQSNQENKELNKKIKHLAYHDFLTNLPNRLSLNEELSNKLLSQIGFSLIFIDINGFKNFNDTKGHVIGDKLLQAISGILSKETDGRKCPVYRYGGDEFIVISDYTNKSDIEVVLSKIYEEFSRPIIIDNINYMIDLSIGISIYPEHGITAADLIRKADIAMYKAKHRSINDHVFYVESMGKAIEEDNRVVSEIKNALKNNGFKIVVQPQYDVKSNEIVSYEALARIKDSNTNPFKFIQVAERVNLINSIGEVILEKAIHFISNLKKEKKKVETIYINISAKQLGDETLFDYLNSLLKKYDIEPHNIGFELTESSLIEDDQLCRDFIAKTKQLGIKIAIDDFGSGQAGLNYLTDYDVDMVKFDRHFCTKYLTDDKIEVFNTTVKLSNLLGFKVLAEGIETKEQVDILIQTKCDYVQGYYYSKPIEIEDVFNKS